MKKIKSMRLVTLVLALACFMSVAAQRTLTGRVTDPNGELLIGVTITERGTQNAVATDINGSYTINLKGKSPVIVATYIGYKKFEQKVSKDQTLLDIIMQDEVNELNELVVTGYGQQRRIATVGAQSSVKAEQLKMPAANLSSSIAGRLSGVVAVQRSGEPGHDDADIWIRGISTFTNQNTKPLILVDGVERSFNQIDINDIEEFTILKDASATAVYGVRGANGVILITTKPGTVSKPKFSFDFYQGFTHLSKTPDICDGIEYMTVANEARSNAGLSPLYTQAYIEATKKASGLAYDSSMIPSDRIVDSYLYPNVNWMKEIFSDWGWNQRFNASVRGGVPNASYYVSLSYYNEKGITNAETPDSYDVNIRYNRYNFLTNVNLRPTTRTRIDVGAQGYFTDGHYPAISTGDVFGQAMAVPPVSYALMFPDGSVPGLSSNGDNRNPLADLTRRGYKDETQTQVYSNLKVTQDLDFWDWSKGLSIYALMSYDVNSTNYQYYSKRESTYYVDSPKDNDGLWITPYDEEGNLNLIRTFTSDPTLGFGRDWGGTRKFYLEGALNYNRVFGVHRVGGLLLYNQEDLRYQNVGTIIAAVPYKKMGMAFRGTYSFDDRYFLELNAGYNGSENFAPGNRFGFFPAIGIAWVPSNEKFWRDHVDNSIISFAKIRYTNGYVGSDSNSSRRFGYRTIMSSSTDGYNWGTSSSSGVAITDYGVSIQWSRSHKQDIGLDLKFMNNRLNLQADYFYEYRDKVFLDRGSIPDYIGLNSMPSGNLGIIKNHGVEVSLDYTQPIGKDFTVTFRGNFTYNTDEVVENDSPTPEYPWMSRIGHGVNSRFGYVALGLFTSEEEIENSPYQFGESAETGHLLKVGDVKYKDLNGDGVIDSYDICEIGHGDVPKFYYGFGADLRYKNFSLGMLFQGTGGADRCLGGQSIHPFSGNAGADGNLYANIADRWSADDPTNQNVFYPRLGYGATDIDNMNNYKTSTWWQKDVSFVRLKQLNVNYYLPRHWLDRAGISNARLYAMGTNLFTFSSFKLWDPELNTNNGMSYPNVMSISVGFSFDF